MSAYVLEQRVAEAIAREAGQLILRGRGADFDVTMKGENDYVTAIDTAVERFVKGALREAFPDDAVHGEEQGTSGQHDGRCWYVDPIDGTTNFVHGIPVYCVSIALREDDRWVAGAIHDPNRDELFSGRLGGDATLNGSTVAVSDRRDLSQAILATGFPPMKTGKRKDNLDQFVRVTNTTRAIRRLGSAALDLAYVAAGRLDGFWEFQLNPWDTGAGAFLVTLAGGRVTTIDGGSHTGFEANIVATNARLHDHLLETLRSE